MMLQISKAARGRNRMTPLRRVLTELAQDIRAVTPYRDVDRTYGFLSFLRTWSLVGVQIPLVLERRSDLYVSDIRLTAKLELQAFDEIGGKIVYVAERRPSRGPLVISDPDPYFEDLRESIDEMVY